MIVYCKCGWWGTGKDEDTCPMCSLQVTEDKHERETSKSRSQIRRLQHQKGKGDASERTISNRKTQKGNG